MSSAFAVTLVGTLIGAVSVVGCGQRSAEREVALRDIERLAFVPVGRATFPARSGPPVICENASALLVDRFEVPRRDWLDFQHKSLVPIDPVLGDQTATWNDDSFSWAASWMTLDEARAFAKDRGMRLPTGSEWIRIACGTRALPFPWGQPTSLVANTVEMHLSRPVPVGTFEQGATLFSTYEMCGNVWEWVEEPIAAPGADDSRERALEPVQAAVRVLQILMHFGALDHRLPTRVGVARPWGAWAMGGAFTSQLRSMYSLDDYGRVAFEHLELDPHTRGEDVGFRCVVDAREWLIAHADAFGTDPDTHARLIAVGRRFGRDARAVLEDVRGSGHASPAIAWLLEGAQK